MKTKEKDINILAIGSSMSLVNLYSPSVVNHFENEKYLNISSFGMTMQDNFSFLKSVTPIYKNVNKIIISANIADFGVFYEKKVDYCFVENYLNSNYLFTAFLFIKNFNLKYYINKFKYAKKVRNCIDNDCLDFDANGALIFKEEKIKNEALWNDDYLDELGKDSEYNYLDSISAYCKQEGFQLILFHTPLREGIMNKLDSVKIKNLTLHINRVDGILKKYDFFTVDFRDRLWADSLFTDAIHFNRNGAFFFTEYCLDKIDNNLNLKSMK